MKIIIAVMSFAPGIALSICAAILEMHDKAAWPWFFGFAILFLLMGITLFDKKIV